MRTLTVPGDGDGGRRTLGVALLLAVAVAAAVLVVWLLWRRPPEGPKGPPQAPRALTSPPATPSPSPTSEARAMSSPRSEPRPAPASPLLQVDADVPGANVFLDRRFLGTTPVEAGGVAPGPHRLNVSAEGYEMYGETVELRPGRNEVTVRFKEVRLDERIDVVHRHGVGSCRGRLVATTAGLRYEADKAGDSFEAPLASLEPLQVDYLKKNLRVKQRGGKTWNFSSDSADTLLVFQRNVEKAREKLSS
ncbi:MAG TPA: PEGA domain-containing protein [Vicinamibacteria bacterium]|nr:PEGA domain-containing protein [Vicinamibacteria bacterium]